MKKTLKSIQAKYGIVSEQAPTMRPSPDVSKSGELPSFSYDAGLPERKAKIKKALKLPGGLLIILSKLKPASRQKAFDQIVEVLAKYGIISEQEEMQSQQKGKYVTIHDIAYNGLPNGKTTGTFTIEKEGEFHILKLDGIRIG